MKTIGLTGGIASGKSLVISELKKIGINTISSDEIARDVYYNSDISKRIKSIFGTLDRKKIANIMFSDIKKRKLLEKIIHPIVIREIKRKIQNLREKNVKIVVVDVPLLFEAKIGYLFDKIIVVYCDNTNQIKRLINRDKINKSKAVERIGTQISLIKKVKMADYIIDNTMGKLKIRTEIKKILDKIK
ncbi:MAG TPA: dephospho-CoA kinase [Elusimicrobia bacterium]|nr:MAG: dephospho-CoA kinase [Elusimicrobia bacterium RIFOXYD2_FULL_34_30]HAM39350.1 dephospho-CoA kinase [Elusimicrobiota bacterium]